VQLKLPVYLQKSMTVLVNGQPVWNATFLKDNDSVKLMRMLSGG
jgi:sulfur carrier protein ThiS